MKILLIYPYPLFDRIVGEEDISVVPIGLYYVGAVLKENNYDVEVLNWYNIHKTPQRIPEILQEKMPDIIGFSVLNANRWAAIEIARIARQINPGVKIVFGGVAATFLWNHFLSHFPQVDYVVIGEGEYSFLNLVRSLEEKGHGAVGEIAGIAYRKDGKIRKSGPSQVIRNLDNLPIPARHFEYRHLVLSRGCPWRCSFCGSPRLWGRKVRFHSVENFVEHLEILYGNGITSFYVSDDNFTINKKMVIEICKRIIDRGLKITWVAISRVNYVDEQILYWMRKAGCTQISYGVESGSDRIRDVLSKDVNADQAEKAFAMTQSYGIMARAYFIYGSPGEDRDTIRETIDFMKVIKPLICVFYILEIYPGTGLYADYLRRLGRTDDVWLNMIEGICYFETDPLVPKEAVLEFGKMLRTSLYKNIPDFVRSLHLVDKPELFSMHADFCSRLGMTFTHGDYSKVEEIEGKEKIAEDLFKKALGYCHDHRAYLGLAIIRQNRRDFSGAANILHMGISHFPQSAELNLCLGINLMNQGDYRSALSRLERLKDSKEAAYYIEQCRKAL